MGSLNDGREDVANIPMETDEDRVPPPGPAPTGANIARPTDFVQVLDGYVNLTLVRLNGNRRLTEEDIRGVLRNHHGGGGGGDGGGRGPGGNRGPGGGGTYSFDVISSSAFVQKLIRFCIRFDRRRWRWRSV